MQLPILLIRKQTQFYLFTWNQIVALQSTTKTRSLRQ